jgi:alkylation response protein AidB-like acyl-CoA dehydrogenase
MDFQPTPDQEALRSAVAAVCADRFGSQWRHATEAAGGQLDRARWSELAELGVFSLRLDGFAMSDTALVFEALGAGLVPGPLVASHLAAGLIDGAADGSTVVGFVEDEAPVLVEFPSDVDVLLIGRSNGIYAAERNELVADAVARPLDSLTPLALVRQLPTGRLVLEADAADDFRRRGAVLSAALLSGIASACVELARSYASTREQFGRPIGGFQAIKHLIADLLVQAQVASVAVHAAAVNDDQRDVGDVDRAASVAKLLAGEAAVACAEGCIQVHGGMGFTWEVDAQRYWKRACVLDTHFGGSDHHGEAVAATL